jgi:hypothetical protein
MKTETTQKECLGDSVYAQFDGYHIVLTTENGVPDDPSNRIAIEPAVMDALIRYEGTLRGRDTKGVIDADNKLAKSVLESVANFESAAEAMKKNLSEVAHLLPLLSDTASINAFGGTVWFTVTTREDVQTLMQLSERWNKGADENGINYESAGDYGHFRIQTRDAALPPTCKLVEREVVMPAQPEKTVKKMVVECATQEAAEAV